SDDEGNRRDGAEKEDREVEGEDDGVARAADETGQPRREAERRRRPEQRPAEPSDAEARAGRRSHRPARAAGAAEHEAIDAGVEIAQRAQLLAQFVDSLFRSGIHAALAARDAAPAVYSARVRGASCPRGPCNSWRVILRR